MRNEICKRAEAALVPSVGCQVDTCICLIVNQPNKLSPPTLEAVSATKPMSINSPGAVWPGL
jgi:hypothetical protein